MNATFEAIPAQDKYQLLSRFCSGAVFVIGALVLLGWLLQLNVLTQLHSTLIPMRSVSAVSFLLAGLGLLFLSSTHTPSIERAGRAAGVVLFIVGAFSVIDLLTPQYDLGTIKVLANAPGGRIPFPSAIAFLFTGSSMLLMRRQPTLAQFFAMVVGCIGLFGILTNLFGGGFDVPLPPSTGMAVHSGLAFSLVSFALLLSSPQTGLISSILGRNRTAKFVRKISAVAVLLPVVFGWLLFHVIRVDALEGEVAILLYAVCIILALTAFLTITARSFQETEVEAERIFRQLQQSEEKFRRVIEHSTNLFYSHTADHVLTFISPQTRTMLDCEPEEALTSWTEFITDNPVNQKGFDCTVNAITTGKQQPPYELELVGKKGRRIWVEVHEKPVVENGKTVAIVGALTDITDRKHADVRQEAIYRIAQAADEAEDIDQLFQSIHEAVGTIMDAKNFYIALYHEENNLISFPYYIDETDPDGQSSALVTPGTGLTEYVLRTGSPFLCDMKTFDELVQRGETELVGENSLIWLGVPLQAGHKTVGVLAVQHYSNPQAYGIQEQHILEYVSTQIAKSIERKLAEKDILEARRRYEDLVNSIQAIVFEADLPDLRLSFISRQSEQVLGLTPMEVIERQWRKLIHPDDHQRVFDECVKSVQDGQDHVLEYRMITVSGEIKWMRDVATVVTENGSAKKLRGVLIDITDIKAAEKAIITAKEKAEQADKLKSAFIATVSHEIRTPLNIILGYNELLSQLFLTNLPDEYASLFNEIETASKRLVRTVDLILSLSRIEAGDVPIQRKRTVLANLVEECVRDLTPRALLKNLSLTFDTQDQSTCAFVDSYMIEQAVINLIENAIKFTPSGSIACRLTRKDPQTACLEISDTGIGISEEYLQNVFDPYTQEDTSYTRPYEGIGLGLSLVKRYLELNGASIKVDSEKGQGTTFTLCIPTITEGEDWA